MKKGPILEGLLIGAIFILWLFHPQMVQESIGQGVDLCIQVVFPSLFPFFVLSHLLIGRNHHGTMTSLLGPWMKRIGLPAQGASCLILGALGGYPMGAVTTYNLYEKGLLTKKEAARLLGCSNFAGPGYIFGVLGLGVFSSVSVGCMLYLGHILAGILVARTGLGKLDRNHTTEISVSNLASAPVQSLATTLTQALTKGVRAMATVCGCIIFFFLTISCINKWCFGALSPLLACFLSGLVEMTTGASMITGNTFVNFALVGFFLGWGGLCIHMQVHGLGGLPMTTYYGHKLLHGLYGALLTPLLVTGPTWGVLLFLLCFFLVPYIVPKSRTTKDCSCNFVQHRVY